MYPWNHNNNARTNPILVAVSYFDFYYSKRYNMYMVIKDSQLGLRLYRSYIDMIKNDREIKSFRQWKCGETYVQTKDDVNLLINK